MAVLYRMNALSRGIEQALLEKGISYRVIRGLAFYERLEVKDVLRCFVSRSTPETAYPLPGANVPVRGGKKSVELLSEQLQKTAGIERPMSEGDRGDRRGPEGEIGQRGQRTGKEYASDPRTLLRCPRGCKVRALPQATRNTLRPTTLKTGRSGSRTFLKYFPGPEEGDIAQVLTEIPSSPIRTQGTILRTGSTSSRSMLQRDSSSRRIHNGDGGGHLPSARAVDGRATSQKNEGSVTLA